MMRAAVLCASVVLAIPAIAQVREVTIAAIPGVIAADARWALAWSGTDNADGIVGPRTWAALIVTVRQGSSGDAVRGVQEEFQFRNLSGDPSRGLQVDGIFGPRTEEAVRGFQQALSLDVPSVAVDGIVGPITWRALVSGMLAG